MLGRGKVGEEWVSVSMFDTDGWVEVFFGYSNSGHSGGSKYMGSLLGFRRAVNSRREVGSRDYSSKIVANSRSSLYLRNMVELVVDFTSSGILKQSK